MSNKIKRYKRTQAQIESDLSLITFMIIRSNSLQQITEALNKKNKDYHLDKKTVFLDIQKVWQQWREKRTGLIDSFVDNYTQKLAYIENELFTEWENSKKLGMGEPKYLALVLQCIEKGQKLLGCGETPNSVTNNVQINIQSGQVAMDAEQIELERQRIEKRLLRQIRNKEIEL
jgi:phage-related holin